MFLIVGLGNPGKEYQNNRHNIGFKVVDSLIQTLGAMKQSSKNFQGELYKSSTLLLLKPSTFMNLSGESVQSVLNFYKITDFLVIHDELDLPFGAVKFKFGGGNGGHNGLKSIDSLCSNAYYRIRYGIGKPAIKAQVINWVLQDFSALEEEQNQTLIAHCAKAALEIAKLESSKELANKVSSIFTLVPKLQNESPIQNLDKDFIKSRFKETK
ncbi:aminoacyl-tRNA hydrolase [Helicobacter rodentium]|uniref:aminoacyl-tRNA hydrolase n=1 Tax=Helicobacter rodentium TaxID=59617 RepID=UPI0023F187EB|nr:aminoacyl-tRNA hydrolase [Helicobacter rodentium]